MNQYEALLVLGIVLVLLIVLIMKYIELSNKEVVYPLKKEKLNSYKDLVNHYKWTSMDTLPIGFNEDDEIEVMNIKDIENLYIIGTTGGGKSVLLNELIVSIMNNYSSEEAKILTMDTSLVEFSMFNGSPYYLKDTICTPQDITEALEELKKDLSRKKKEEILFVVIDDLYDIVSYDKKNLKVLEALLKESKENNIHFIVTTDTPTKEVFSSKIRKYFKGTIYLTLAPGEEKDFSIEKELTEEEWNYLAEVGNIIYKTDIKTVRMIIPDSTDEELKEMNKGE